MKIIYTNNETNKVLKMLKAVGADDTKVREKAERKNVVIEGKNEREI